MPQWINDFITITHYSLLNPILLSLKTVAPAPSMAPYRKYHRALKPYARDHQKRTVRITPADHRKHCKLYPRRVGRVSRDHGHSYWQRPSTGRCLQQSDCRGPTPVESSSSPRNSRVAGSPPYAGTFSERCYVLHRE